MTTKRNKRMTKTKEVSSKAATKTTPRKKPATVITPKPTIKGLQSEVALLKADIDQKEQAMEILRGTINSLVEENVALAKDLSDTVELSQSKKSFWENIKSKLWG